MSSSSKETRTVVISQPMYFPWVGLLEQIRLADIFVFYNDVQYTKGFYNRVQVKTANGVNWLTVPLSGFSRGQLINEVAVDNSKDWKKNHREILRQAYLKAPYLDDMLKIVDEIFSRDFVNLSDVGMSSTLAVSRYFGLDRNVQFLNSEDLDVPGSSSQRLLDVVKKLEGNRYITGHGARNYLDHQIFESAGVAVEYMDYKKMEYPQLHGAFTPYVSSLDLVANCGPAGVGYICSDSISWRSFIS